MPRLLIQIYPLANRTGTAAICKWSPQPLHELPTLAILFLRERPQLYNIAFSKTIVARTWQIAKQFAQITTIESKLRFYVVFFFAERLV
jgi:hypothetical protein